MRNIFFIAVNDISKTSKFNETLVSGVEYKGENTRFWGITELSLSTFQKINKGDIAFFYHKGVLVAKGIIAETFVNKELSEMLWGSYIHKLSSQKLFWSNILKMSDFKVIHLDFQRIVQMGGYSSKFTIRRLIAMNEKGMEFLRKNFKSEIDWYNSL